jgi:hypothetical protein
VQETAAKVNPAHAWQVASAWQGCIAATRRRAARSLPPKLGEKGQGFGPKNESGQKRADQKRAGKCWVNTINTAAATGSLPTVYVDVECPK